MTESRAADREEEGITLRSLLTEAEQVLARADVPDFKLDARILMVYILSISEAEILLDSGHLVSRHDVDRYRCAVARRSRREPLQYITGEQEFMGLPFLVTPDVLIPRQDTETLVETAEKYLHGGERILDLCTGSGCIAVSLSVRKKAVVCGTDLSGKALRIAEENGRRNHADITWIRSDIYSHVTGGFDMIVSNPPYIQRSVIGGLMPEVRKFEPKEALDGGEDGLFFYRKIISGAPAHLQGMGRLLVEIGFDQAGAVSRMFTDCGFRNVEVIRDLAGCSRVVSGVCRTCPGEENDERQLYEVHG